MCLDVGAAVARARRLRGFCCLGTLVSPLCGEKCADAARGRAAMKLQCQLKCALPGNQVYILKCIALGHWWPNYED